MMLFQWTVLAVSLAGPAFSTPLSTPTSYIDRHNHKLGLAPLIAEHHVHGSINNSYIIMLKHDMPQALMANHLNFLQSIHQEDPLDGHDSGIKHVYDGHIRGYAGRFSDSVVAKLREMPEVDFIEQDQVVRIQDHQTQKSAPWGLARISHRPKLTLGTFQKYEYDSEGGEGVNVYVIDTGINVEHEELQGRSRWGQTIPQNDVDEDGNGHGSHCAGTIASRSFGVAKKATVIAVKVLGSNGSGSMSDVVSGVVWAASDAKKEADKAKAEFAATGKTKHKGSVANMSLGGGKSPALDRAVDGAVESGLHFAVAAGNDNQKACNYSPAASEKAITVGASTLSDERAYFSNHGTCVDVFAPGLNILSIYKGSRHATATLSGTSMASPHVAGLLAYLLSLYPSATFDPNVEDDFIPLPLQTQSTFASPAPIYAVVRSALPSWVSGFLPSRRLVDAVTGPSATGPKTLTPNQLKKALLQLSSKNILRGDLGEGSPNLLIFNNATAAY